MPIRIPVTSHFSVNEFESHDGLPYPSTWIDERLRPLCAVLEAVRTAVGNRAVTILSGYRSPAHNASVGGAKASQHMEGRAADITVEGMAPSDVHAIVLSMFEAKKIEIGGLGLYEKWIHLDIRPRPESGHLCQWSGSKVGDEVA